MGNIGQPRRRIEVLPDSEPARTQPAPAPIPGPAPAPQQPAYAPEPVRP